MVTFRAPIESLSFKAAITAGMSPYVLLGLVPLLRKTSEDHEPIQVTPPCDSCGVRTVLDGRHRWIASVLAGRPDVLATEHTEPT